jgi:hypothetical protein
VVDEVRRRLAQHLEEAGDGLAPDLIGTAAQISVATGGPEAWNEVLDAYRRAEGPQDRLRYLYALAETPLADLRMETLELAVGPDVRSQDAPFVIAGVMARRDATPHRQGPKRGARTSTTPNSDASRRRRRSFSGR